MKRIISFLCIVVISLFLSVSDCIADEFESQLNNNISADLNPNSIKNNNNKQNDKANNSNEDIFGDEQAFPFIAGLGKNAAH